MDSRLVEVGNKKVILTYIEREPKRFPLFLLFDILEPKLI